MSEEKLSTASKEDSEKGKENRDTLDAGNDTGQQKSAAEVNESEKNNIPEVVNTDNQASAADSSEQNGNDKVAGNNINEKPESEQVAMHVIGNDDNVRIQSLDALQVAQVHYASCILLFPKTVLYTAEALL